MKKRFFLWSGILITIIGVNSLIGAHPSGDPKSAVVQRGAAARYRLEAPPLLHHNIDFMGRTSREGNDDCFKIFVSLLNFSYNAFKAFFNCPEGTDASGDYRIGEEPQAW